MAGTTTAPSAGEPAPRQPGPVRAPWPLPGDGPPVIDLSVAGPTPLRPYHRAQDRPRDDRLRRDPAPGGAAGAAGDRSPDVHIGQITVVTPPAAPAAADPFGSVAHLRRGRPHRGEPS